jgi:small subunit ribosomal protein S1
VVSIGEEIEAVVLKVDPDDEKISLGMKQIEEDPWLALPVKYPVGTKVEGTVRNLTSFGAFVEIEPGIDGLIHISDMSWTRRIQHPSEVLKKSEQVEVMVLGVDAENKRISLGLKQMSDDPWYRLVEQYAPGVETQGGIARMLDDGVVVDLGDDVEGFVPISQIPIENMQHPSDHLVEEQELELRVLESDAVNRRIVLAVTEIHEPPEKQAEEQAGAEAEAEIEAGAEAEAETEAEAEAEAEAEVEAETEAETEAEAEAEAEAETETKVEAGEEAEASADNAAENEDEDDSEDEADSDAEPETKDEA